MFVFFLKMMVGRKFFHLILMSRKWISKKFLLSLLMKTKQSLSQNKNWSYILVPVKMIEKRILIMFR